MAKRTELSYILQGAGITAECEGNGIGEQAALGARSPGNVIGQSDQPVTPSFVRRGRKGCWRRILITLVVAFIVLTAATARLFIWPVRGIPAQVNAIVMLDGPGNVLSVAVRLAEQHRSPFLVVSRGSAAYPDPCPAPIARVKLICFLPKPPTTQGEAEFVGRLARKYGWRSVALVAITPQDSRARLRVERCFAGHIYVVTAPIAPTSWPYEIAYEWGALLKALVIQRGC